MPEQQRRVRWQVLVAWMGAKAVQAGSSLQMIPSLPTCRGPSRP